MEGKNFNAASYLFVSNHLSHLHPHLTQSRIIMEFSTPWPKISYKIDTIDVKSSYQKNSFSFFIQFIERISIFLLTHFLSIPSSLQDGVIHLISTSGLGYLIPTFMKLYEISPVLVIVFVIVLLFLIHFLIRLDDQERKNMLRDMSKKPSISPSSLEKSTSIENVEWKEENNHDEIP